MGCEADDDGGVDISEVADDGEEARRRSVDLGTSSEVALEE
jgi:hypothetical protein